MRHLFVLCVLLTFALPAFSQKWEFGAVGGWGFYSNHSVTGGSGTAEAGFAGGPAAGVFLGNNMYRYLGGELRYEYQQNDLQVSSGSTKFNFQARAHAIHYDILFHLTPVGSRIRPFVAAGGGVKIYQGTGTEASVQPLNSYAILTKTNQTTGLVSVGGGLKIAASSHVSLRLEVRDFITPFPTNVVTPVPPAKISGWLHNILTMAGLSYTW